MELVDRVDIQKYAKRNTSPHMPIEAKYVQAFIDALMNSTSVQELYSILQSEMQNGDAYVIYSSYSVNARNLNREPYRSIIAYAMLKKDFRLFELISASMFTGSVQEYHGSDLYNQLVKTTDEQPTRYTDEGTYTDMNEGLIQIGFKNYYCEDPLEDGTGSEYQTIEELQKALTDFDYIITLTKPARVQVLLFFVPWCYLSGDANTIKTCGIYRPGIENPDLFSCPFGDELSMNIIDNMSNQELAESYSQISMYDYDRQMELTISSEKTVRVLPKEVIFDYEFRCQKSSSSHDIYTEVIPVGIENPVERGWYEATGTGAYIMTTDTTVHLDKTYYTRSTVTDNVTWGTIKIVSNVGNLTFAESKRYREEEEYYEKYIPIMLRINDNDPDGPCLALEIEHGIPTIGAMFYERERRQ